MGAAARDEGDRAKHPLGRREPFRGIFPIVQTPFREDETIDVACLRREVEFIIKAGGHGLCWPQAGSEFELLTDDERLAVSELLVRQAHGRVPVIIGVQSTNYWKTALDFARHAEYIGADGIISMAPFQAGPSPEDIAEYYRALSRTVSLPIFIQSASNRYGPAMPVDMVLALARECPTVSYIKDEAEPTFERITALCERGEGVMRGVFSGGGASNLMDEMSVGSHGSCPGADLTDVFARVYDLYQGGDTAGARALFDALAPMLRLKVKAHWMLLMKERLRRRGVFETTRSRTAPYELAWDDPREKRAFDEAYEAIEPLFRI
jgi:dihydrodipicolinate synthase/N-acetylneuraminate lyase